MHNSAPGGADASATTPAHSMRKLQGQGGCRPGVEAQHARICLGGTAPAWCRRATLCSAPRPACHGITGSNKGEGEVRAPFAHPPLLSSLPAVDVRQWEEGEVGGFCVNAHKRVGDPVAERSHLGGHGAVGQQDALRGRGGGGGGDGGIVAEREAAPADAARWGSSRPGVLARGTWQRWLGCRTSRTPPPPPPTPPHPTHPTPPTHPPIPPPSRPAAVPWACQWYRLCT